MFQAFTGSSKRPRQVNLSGKVANPFATSSVPTTSTPPPTSQTTLAYAQAERLQRQQERARLNRVKLLQRLWRGQQDRRRARQAWRNQWDHSGDRIRGAGSDKIWKGRAQAAQAFGNEQELTEDLRLILHFGDLQDEDDLLRVLWTCARLRATPQDAWLVTRSRATSYILLRYQADCLRVLQNGIHTTILSGPAISELLSSIAQITTLIGEDVSHNADLYYHTLSTVLRGRDKRVKSFDEAMISAAVTPLGIPSAASAKVYASFAFIFLTTPNLSTAFCKQDSLRHLFGLVNHTLLAASILQDLAALAAPILTSLTDRDRAWLLSYFIHVFDQAFSQRIFTIPPEDYISVLSALLASLDCRMLTNPENPIISPVVRKSDPALLEDEQSVLPSYIHEKISSLVDRRTVMGLLKLIEKLDPVQERSFPIPLSESSSQTFLSGPNLNGTAITDNTELARITAEFILGLIRFFPKRADDIRMWINLGTGSDMQRSGRHTALQYFYNASCRTQVYQAVKLDPRAFLKFAGKRQGHSGWSQSPGETHRRRECCISLLFLQLYSFVLRVTDDEEFFGPQDPTKSHSVITRELPLTNGRAQNRIPLDDVRDLIIFLKNLAFALYYYQADLQRNQARNGGHEGSIRPRSSPIFILATSEARRSYPTPLFDNGAMTTGSTDDIDETKGLVTGLLRSLYERDSRRSFLPSGAWLMTQYFDMEKFIPDVVAEEEQRHLINEGDEDMTDGTGEINNPYREADLVGTGHVQQQRRSGLVQRQQQEISRQRRLEAIAPRLEIMQNMPFFIPFETRVQIFRQFVHLDQMRRRSGYVDPQQWRLWVVESMSNIHPSENEVLRRHSATIRRGTLLEDAFEQFWRLGDGLKEPISISFIDVHGVEEEGIDGGGVTKEFLTSVTNEAFNPNYGLHMFNETAKNLLYPNPTVMDERSISLQDIGFEKGSTDYNEGMRLLLQRYEFLGRIVGKCLYEGILVDLAFAPFFLLKWSLTGGRNAAARENGFRASVNDLRDLDEELYQGLIGLKTYAGSFEDLGLTFSVDDQIEVDGRMVTVTHELGSNLGKMPVINETRLMYINLLSKYRLVEQQKKQTEAFLKGLSSIVQPMWLSLFNQSELQTLVGGSERQIDVEDLRRNTAYGGLYTIGDDGCEHETVILFWDVLGGLSEEDKRQVLKFVTSTPRAPLLGFSQLNPPFSIRDGGSDEGRLPTASTCVNLLKLPRYTTSAQLEKKLLHAVNSGAGFGFS